MEELIFLLSRGNGTIVGFQLMVRRGARGYKGRHHFEAELWFMSFWREKGRREKKWDCVFCTFACELMKFLAL